MHVPQVLNSWATHVGSACSGPLNLNIRLQVGRDVSAELLKSALSDAGVKLDHLQEVEGPSGTAIILVQPSGTFYVLPVPQRYQVGLAPET